MVPGKLEVLRHHVVRHVLLTGLGHQVTGIEGTAILVSLGIVGLGGKPPRTLREDFSQHLQVNIITDGKVISPVTKIEATVHFIPESRHDETRRITAAEREKSEWYGNGQRNILHHQLGRAEHHILLRAHLGLSELQIEVRMFMIASGIFTVTDIELIARTLLGLLTGYISLPLLGNDTIDETLLRLEVIAHGLRFVWRITFLEHRSSGFSSQRILDTLRIHHAAVHVHGYDR